MFTNIGSAAGRSMVIYLSKGEKILEGIQQAVSEAGWKNAVVVSGIGSARKICYHRIESTRDEPENTYFTIEAPCEISAIQGLVLNGEPHCHIAFADTERAYGGHLEPGCEVQFLAEIVIEELPGHEDLYRIPSAYGVTYIDKEKK